MESEASTIPSETRVRVRPGGSSNVISEYSTSATRPSGRPEGTSISMPVRVGREVPGVGERDGSLGIDAGATARDESAVFRFADLVIEAAEEFGRERGSQWRVCGERRWRGFRSLQL